VKEGISGIQERIIGVKDDTQEIKEITSQLRNFHIGE
jgi:hypothetical protein